MPTSPPRHKSRRLERRHSFKSDAEPKPQTNRQLGRALHTGSKGWRAIRRQILVRDMYLCRGCDAFGNQVDHVNNDSHDNRPDNLQTLCVSCHSRKTAREKHGRA